jgi:hypothetical protein
VQLQQVLRCSYAAACAAAGTTAVLVFWLGCHTAATLVLPKACRTAKDREVDALLQLLRAIGSIADLLAAYLYWADMQGWLAAFISRRCSGCMQLLPLRHC